MRAIHNHKRQGYTVGEAKPDGQGFVTPVSLAARLQPDTVVASVLLAHNELGCIQPVAELAETAHERGACLHTDAVQALGKMEVDVQALAVDAASFSAHKIGGPKGIGALYLRSQAPYLPLMKGGGQEGGRRGGTQNVAGAVGFAKAVELACGTGRVEAEARRLAALRDRLIQGLTQRLECVATAVDIPPGDTARHLPNIVPLLVQGISSEMMVLRLDEAGFAVSGGSACSAGANEPNYVLEAIGIPRQQAEGALRLSLGHATTEADVDALTAALLELLED